MTPGTELERLAVIESKLEEILCNQKDMWPNINIVCQASALLEQRLRQLEEKIKSVDGSLTWAWRTAVGATVAALASGAVALLFAKGGTL